MFMEHLVIVGKRYLFSNQFMLHSSAAARPSGRRLKLAARVIVLEAGKSNCVTHRTKSDKSVLISFPSLNDKTIKDFKVFQYLIL